MMFRIKNAPRNALERREFRVENYRCLCLLLIIRQRESSTMSIDALDDSMGWALPLQLNELFPIAPTIHDDSPMRRDQNALFFTLYNNVIKSNWKFQNSFIIWLSLSLGNHHQKRSVLAFITVVWKRSQSEIACWNHFFLSFLTSSPNISFGLCSSSI